MKIENWPLFGLRVRTPRLELRYPDDDVIDALIDVALGGVHDPGQMPFFVPWTDAPPEQLRRDFVQFHWSRRTGWSAADWNLELAVMVDGRPIGTQGVGAKQFAIARQFATGSWLGLPYQGAGLGKEMRAAILHLAFAGLGGAWATTEAFADNPASLAVTRALGYEPDGEEWYARRGEAARNLRFRMSRAAWETRRRTDIEIIGLEPCLPMFGLG